MKAICVTLNPALDKYLYLNALQVDALNRTDRSIPMSAGGKGINVARALTVLGDKAINLFLSGGSTGKLLERLLHTEGQITVVTETVAQTRLNVKVVTPDSYTEINEKGGPVSPKEAAAAFFSYESVLEGEKPDCVVISGSIPTGMDTNIYRRMLERAKQAGILTMLDCDGISLKKGMETKPFLIKPNLDELRGLTGKSLENLDEIISICRELYRESGTVVLCTMGAKGAVLAGEEGVYTITAPCVNAQFPAGAGDCFLAGFLSAYFHRETPEESLIKAVQMASGKLESPDGLPGPLEKEKYRSQIVCKKIS